MFQPFFLISDFFAYDTLFWKIQTGQTNHPKTICFTLKYLEISELPCLRPCPRLNPSFLQNPKRFFERLGEEIFSHFLSGAMASGRGGQGQGQGQARMSEASARASEVRARGGREKEGNQQKFSFSLHYQSNFYDFFPTAIHAIC